MPKALESPGANPFGPLSRGFSEACPRASSGARTFCATVPYFGKSAQAKLASFAPGSLYIGMPRATT